jgi:hypothetical protein
MLGDNDDGTLIVNSFGDNEDGTVIKHHMTTITVP